MSQMRWPSCRFAFAAAVATTIALAGALAPGSANARPFASRAPRCITVAVSNQAACLRPGVQCKSAAKKTYASLGFLCARGRLHRGNLAVQREGGIVAVGPSGHVGLAAAEQAFIALWGPLPSVKEIPGAVDLNGLRDATGPADWIDSHLAQLSPQQRSVVERATGAASASRATRSDAAVDAALEGLVSTEVTKIDAKVGYTLPFTPTVTSVAHLTTPGKKSEMAWGLTTPQIVGERITGCRIEITAEILGKETDLINTTAHEVVHCFELALAQTISHFNQLPQFVVEGYAEWAGDAYSEENTGSHGDDGEYATQWVDNPFKDLFQRTYDAFGLYTDIGSNAGNPQMPWALLQPIISATTAGGVYALLMNVAGSDFEANLATNNLLSPQLGPRWSFGGPGIDHAAPELRKEAVGNGDTVTIAAPPRAADRAALDLSADLVTITGEAPGGLHLSDGRTLDTASMTLCQLQEGCRCPNGSNPATEGGAMGEAIIAISGGLEGDSVKLEGKSEEKACQQQGVTLTSPGNGGVIANFDVEAACALSGTTLTARLSNLGGGGPLTVELPGFVKGKPTKWDLHAPSGGGPVVTYPPYSSGLDLAEEGIAPFTGGVGYSGRRFFIDADMFTGAGSGGIAEGVFVCKEPKKT
jgi:hypothetical protein